MLYRVSTGTKFKKEAVTIEQSRGEVFNGDVKCRLGAEADRHGVRRRPHHLDSVAHLDSREEAQTLILIAESHCDARLRDLKGGIEAKGETLAGRCDRVELCPRAKDAWLIEITDEADCRLCRFGQVLLNF